MNLREIYMLCRFCQMLILQNKHVDFAKSTCLFDKIDILNVYFVKSTI